MRGAVSEGRSFFIFIVIAEDVFDNDLVHHPSPAPTPAPDISGAEGAQGWARQQWPQWRSRS
jgi:hypothetical protein